MKKLKVIPGKVGERYLAGLNPEDLRIYIIVPETVQVFGRWGSSRREPKTWRHIVMEPGRLMAQCAHVARYMETQEPLPHQPREYYIITTIVLAARTSKELEFYARLLGEKLGRSSYTFSDTNEEFYGTSESMLTAVCTGPVFPAQVSNLLGHLPLYGA